MKTPPHQRPIRSFVLRTGRLTTGQRRALEDLWPEYGVDTAGDPIDMHALFGRTAPTIMEIGFGNGENLVQMAASQPENNFLGVEVHEPGVGHCLLRIAEQNVTNVRLVQHDAVEFLKLRVADFSLARVNLFFPDPWHKKRHQKRRIVQTEFMHLLARKIEPEGIFHAVTDWPDYAAHIAAVLSASSEFCALPEYPGDRTVTRFDTRGKRLGHSNWEQAWRTCSKLPIES